MKISVTYLYAIFKYGYPPKPADDFTAIHEIEKMGFHFLEMEGLGLEHTQGVWNHRHELKSCLQDSNVHVHNFCAVDADLVSLDPSVRTAAYSRFRKTAELGAFLGAETLHIASYAPPIRYSGGSPYALGDSYSFGDTFRAVIPDGFDWRRVWDALVESCRTTARIAAEFGRTLIMEPRVGEVICSVDSMIRVIQDVGEKNFKANFDTGHFSAQRENVPLALKKLEGQYANIHISDNNPVNVEHLPVGDGTIDWAEFFRVLKAQGYDGYLGLDLGGTSTLEDDLRRSAQFIRQTAEKQGIKIEQ